MTFPNFISAKSVKIAPNLQDMAYPKSVGSLIDGKPVKGDAGSWELINPANATQFSTVTGLSSAQVDQAATLAAETFSSGEWANKSLEERQSVFAKICELLLKNADELAWLQCIETGIPYGQYRFMHIKRSADNFRFFSDIATSLSGQTYQQTGRYLSLTMYDPVGVGLVIAPWNAPLVLATMKIAACLITGNSCIVKPSEYTPYSLLRLVEIIIEAGVPSGAIQLVNGQGHSTGADLVAHKKIDAISFVGGTETGTRIMQSAANEIKKVSLELGGKSAAIVLEDADLDAAINGTLLGSFAGNGEQCLSGSRILVQRSIADTFIEKYVDRVKNMTIGDPFSEKVELGPLAFKAHYDRFLSYVDRAKKEGAEILCGGNPIDNEDGGFYVEPVVARAKSNELAICQEEIFGPFTTILIIDDLDEAITIANQSDFGLVSYIWTQKIDSMMQAAQDIRAGTVWVNTAMTRDLRAPFGGYKKSGLGRDGLPGSIEIFTEQKTVMIPTGDIPLPQLGKLD